MRALSTAITVSDSNCEYGGKPYSEQVLGLTLLEEHNAFDDASANSNLFKALVEKYNIDVDAHIRKYVLNEIRQFTQFAASPVIRKAISEFFGVIRGFSIDNVINSAEYNYIVKWYNDYSVYVNQKDISSIISILGEILKDKIVTIEEIVDLQTVIKAYLDVVSSSPITLAKQILDGILKGITVDGEISEIECKNLRQWLYDNIYLSDHFPFNKTIEMLDKVLADSIITEEESIYMTKVISDMLNPVEVLKSQIYSVNGKHICLSGNFEFGQKSDVAEYVISKGGLIDSTVKKTTDVLIIGNCECQAYSNGTYGTKVKKAMEYNDNGCTIQIVKESDFFSTIK